MTALVLARIALNPASRDVQRDLSDAKQMHTTLMRLLPDQFGDQPRKQANLLFRIETDHAGTAVIAQATHALDPGCLPHDYGRTAIKDLAPMLEALKPGLRVRYRIDINPTRSERDTTAADAQGGTGAAAKLPRGTVRALHGAEADAWWAARAAASGLDLDTMVPTTPGWPPRPPRTHRKAVRFGLCRYDGIATVTDPDPLRTALIEGIGRSKPYGAGLLSLLPERTA